MNSQLVSQRQKMFFAQWLASWYCVGTKLIIPTCSFSRTMWKSISMCFVRSWNTKFVVICNAAWLSQKSWASKLHGTDLNTFVCFFYFHEIIEEWRKMQYTDTSCLTTSRLSCNKLSMSDCSRMAITILVPVMYFRTRIATSNEVVVEPLYIDLRSKPKTLYQTK